MSEGNFKVRVVEILRDKDFKTSEAFGEIGQVFEIKDGVLTDLEGFYWTNNGDGYKCVDEINAHLSDDEDDWGIGYSVKFEKYEESTIKDFKVILKNGGDDGWFGNIGRIFEVKNGILTDLDGDTWDNGGIGFNNVEEINTYFLTNCEDIVFSAYNGYPSFKVIVTKTKDETPCRWFGDVGTVLDVVDGQLIDLQGFHWNNGGEKYKNVEDISKRLCDYCGTYFEVYKEPKESDTSLYNGKFRVVRNIGNVSERVFGSIGTEFNVVDGMFKSKTGNIWNNDGEYYKTFSYIKRQLEEKDDFETIIEEVVEEENELYNGTIRVVKNIGFRGERNFGKVGNTIVVKDGSFKDLKGFVWRNINDKPFTSFEEIESFFSEDDNFKTVFEEVSNYSAELYSLDNTMKGLTFDIPKPIALREMTIEEIEKELGYKIRIVSSKEVK